MTLDVEGKPEENCPNNILENYDFGSMPDEKFHRLMNMKDLSYSALFADKVFENTVWNEYEDKEILSVKSISSSEGNYSVVPEIVIQTEDELLNGASPKPVADNETEQEMNSVPCTMVNETDHLTCVDNGNCISFNSVIGNIESTENQLQSSSQTSARSFCSHLGGVLWCRCFSYFFCNCARGLYFSGYALMSCDFWGML